MKTAQHLLTQIQTADWLQRVGQVQRVSGMAIEATGPVAAVGEVCTVRTSQQASLSAEVVAVSTDHIVLMPYDAMTGIKLGNTVLATGKQPQVVVGSQLLGRVLDGAGMPLDGQPLLQYGAARALYPLPIHPLQRAPITDILTTGVRAIDTLLTLGRGQRMGFFAGSGVGKSTLLNSLTHHVQADVLVIALIGERGREVHSMVQQVHDTALRKRTVIVAATADQPPLLRRRAAYLATAIAEYFREQGLHACLLLDSLTRVAMAQREIDLACGALPTARGYTPAVFHTLPKLLERPGVLCSGGSLTGIYTVLVEGDDMDDPIADTARATLDGHIVLSRTIAQRGRYPAIDITRSVSRLATAVVPATEQVVVQRIHHLLAQYESARDLIELGAYHAGSNATLDHAIACMPELENFLTQAPTQTETRSSSMATLQRIAAMEQSV